MSRNAPTNGDHGMIAVLHPVGRSWRCVVSSVGEDGVRLVEAREFDPVETGRIDDWLDQHDPGRTIVVLPAGTVVCRTCQLPNAATEQLLPALRLQAEAHQLGGVPPHRCAMSVLPAAPGETSRSGIILAWPETAATPEVPTRREVTFCPDVAALATLLGAHRPGDPLLWLSRDDASIAMGITHTQGAVFRAAREDADTSDAWAKGVSRAVVESAISVGHSGQYVDGVVASLQQLLAAKSDGAQLVIPGELMDTLSPRIVGTGSDADWWQTFGIAAGAALAAAGELSGLTQMLDEAPADEPSIPERIVRTLSSRRFATGAAMVALAVVVFGPMTFAWTRLKVLQSKVADIEAYDAQLEALEKRVDLYRAVHEESWSMTKLLADIANCTPARIELDKIDIDCGESIVLSGKASPEAGEDAAALVLQMARDLNGSGVFARCDHRLDAESALGSRTFRMTAEVIKPHERPRYDPENDYAVTDLRIRLHGENPYEEKPDEPGDDALATTDDGSTDDGSTDDGATEAPSDPEAGTEGPPDDALATAPPADDTAMPADPEVNDPEANEGEDTASDPTQPRRPVVRGPSGPATGIDRPNRTSRPGNDGVGSMRDRVGGPRNADVPPPLTEAEIKGMTKAEAYEALAKVSKARKNPPDEETEKRLKTEFDLLMKQMKDASK